MVFVGARKCLGLTCRDFLDGKEATRKAVGHCEGSHRRLDGFLQRPYEKTGFFWRFFQERRGGMFFFQKKGGRLRVVSSGPEGSKLPFLGCSDRVLNDF